MKTSANDLSNIYEEASKYLWKVATSYPDKSWDLQEEAVQEGMIRVWKDVESGLDGGDTTKLWILRRAGMRTRHTLFTNGAETLGKPRLSHEGMAHSPTVEKVRIFLSEYLPVHDNIYPPVKVISDGLGIPYASARYGLVRVRAGKFNHGVMMTRSDGSRVKDQGFYTPVSVETLFSDTNVYQGVPTWTDSKAVTRHQVTFEHDLILNMHMKEAITKLAPKYAEALYLHFYVGYSSQEIGERAGFKNNHSANGGNLIKRAVKQLENIMYPYTGSCDNGHKRTEQTIHVFRRTDGVYIRQCRLCNVINTSNEVRSGGRHTARVEDKGICAQHGPKTHLDSAGKLRCHECRRAAQRKYAAKARAKKKAQDESTN